MDQTKYFMSEYGSKDYLSSNLNRQNADLDDVSLDQTQNQLMFMAYDDTGAFNTTQA